MKNSNAKFTPGPWSVNDVNSSDIYGYEAGTRRGRFIAGTVNHAAGNCCHTEEDRSNARLIAAAPELLAALEFCAKMLDDDGGKVQGKMYSDCLSPDSDDMTGIEYIRAAIAKARGEK